jgi:hypothetical protein
MDAELYVSDCCGAVFAPGHGPDDLHDAEAGAELVVQVTKGRTPPGEHSREELRSHRGPIGPLADEDLTMGGQEWRHVYIVSDLEAEQYDAIRAGECPACGEDLPGLTELAVTPSPSTAMLQGVAAGATEAFLDLTLEDTATVDPSDATVRFPNEFESADVQEPADEEVPR